MTTAKPREPWNIRPAKKRASVTASIKAEVETKAKDLIDNVLKPKYILPRVRSQKAVTKKEMSVKISELAEAKHLR